MLSVTDDGCSVPDEQFISIAVCVRACVRACVLSAANSFPSKAQKVLFGEKEEDREKSRMGHQMKLSI